MRRWNRKSGAGAAGRRNVFAPIAICAAFALSACSDPNESEISGLAASIPKDIETIRATLEKDTLPNDRMLARYVVQGKRLKPEHAALIENLAKEGGRENGTLVELENRLAAAVDAHRGNAQPSAEIVEDLKVINAATDPVVIDKGLIDVINTIAALTDGQLKSLGPEGARAGSHLVGNRRYGRWRRRSTGGFFWVWGQPYAGLGQGGAAWTYSNWYYKRPWSHHYDTYGNTYSSRQWRGAEMGRMSDSWSDIEREGKANGRKPSAFAARSNAALASQTSSPSKPPPPPKSNFNVTRDKAAKLGPRNVSSYAASKSSRTPPPPPPTMGKRSDPLPGRSTTTNTSSGRKTSIFSSSARTSTRRKVGK